MMNWGLVTGFLKGLGKTVLPLAEQAGVAAANAALPGIGGTLATLAIDGITAAVTKHAGQPASAVVPVYVPNPTTVGVLLGHEPATTKTDLTVGQSRKLDVLQKLEAAAPDIANMILAGRKEAVIDRAKFVEGVDGLVDNLHKIMQSIGAVPTSAPPTDPVVLSKAPDGTLRIDAADVPTPMVKPASRFMAVQNAAPAGTPLVVNVNAAEIIPVLEGLLAKLTGGK